MKKLLILSTALLVFAACGSDNEDQIEVTSDTVLDSHIFQEAVNLRNTARCSDIQDSTKKAGCETAVLDFQLIDQANEERNVSICNKISDERYEETCKKDVQERVDQGKAYQNAVDEKYQEEREAVEIETRASEADNPDICNEIKDENAKESCRFNIISLQASQSKDPSLCNELVGETYVQKCKSGASAADNS